VLVEVARRGSIAAAAESLSFVPSAISQQIDALERELGIELTARAGRGTVLTTAGRLLVERGRELLRQLDETEEMLRGLNGLVTGRLRIASVPAVAGTLVADATAALVRRHPALDARLIERGRSESFEALRQHDVDLAVVYRYHSLNHLPELRIAQRELVTESLVMAVPPEHPLAWARDVPISRLAGETWIADRQGTDGHLLTQHVCRKAGFEPRVAHSVGDVSVALRLVSLGLGVALIPPVVLRSADRSVATVGLDTAPTSTLLVAWREAVPTEPVQAIVELLASLVEAEPEMPS
jgi:DNA-binding transcriptional LysR family regulator